MSVIKVDQVKTALGITGEYQDETLQSYIDEVEAFLTEAGVSGDHITAGVVSRGVSDLWNYGGADGKFSDYFMMRATQLAIKTK